MNRIVAAIVSRKDLLEALQAIATIVAIAVGGIWTYALTRQYRETVPKLDITQSASSWLLRDGTTLLRIDSILTNSGKVRIEGIDGRMIVLRMLPETDEQAQNFAAGNLWFSCKDDSGKALPDCVEEQGLNLPSESKKTFEIKHPSDSLEPGESLPYWRYLHFPTDVATIEVYTIITKPNAKEDWIFDSTFDLKRTGTLTAGDARKNLNIANVNPR